MNVWGIAAVLGLLLLAGAIVLRLLVRAAALEREEELRRSDQAHSAWLAGWSTTPPRPGDRGAGAGDKFRWEDF